MMSILKIILSFKKYIFRCFFYNDLLGSLFICIIYDFFFYCYIIIVLDKNNDIF